MGPILALILVSEHTEKSAQTEQEWTAKKKERTAGLFNRPNPIGPLLFQITLRLSPKL